MRDWANYYRHVVSKKIVAYVDYQVFQTLLTWINRRHQNKSSRWKQKQYFRWQGLHQWVFFSTFRDVMG
ncbi:group II intron maturase-specific domain-containing protein [Serratia marcescens]|uniref:group II intron maturase-specific domain-containing protein n=1 Tax=Serratia TaxID=613 RepID=UPI003D15F44E